jgi:hypothetical protein
LLGFSGGRSRQPSPPNGLEIALLGLGRQRRATSVRGAYVGPIHRWWLRGQGIPWWSPELTPPEGTPTAACLWAWAAGREPSAAMLDDLDRLLGVDPSRGAGRLRSLQVESAVPG